MKTNYKLLALMPLFVLTGCGEKRAHRNVITNIATKGATRSFVLKDIDTNAERIFVFSRTNLECCDYLQQGDTISIFTGGLNRSDKAYQEKMILNYGEFGIGYNADTVRARRYRAVQEIYARQSKQR